MHRNVPKLSESVRVLQMQLAQELKKENVMYYPYEGGIDELD